MRDKKIKWMVQIALVAALLCVVSPLTILLPISPVPISLATFIVYICTVIVGTKRASLAFLIYLLIGLIGVPVFSGYRAGFPVLMGPTGGYLLGYIWCVIFTGIFVEKFENKIYMYALGMVIGTAFMYLMGLVWLAINTGTTFGETILAGVVPFLAFDVAKIIIATLTGYKIRKILKPYLD